MSKILLAMLLGMAAILALASPAFALTTTQLDYPGATRTFTLSAENFFSAGGGWSDRFVSAGEGTITGNKNVPVGWTVAVNGSGGGYPIDVFEVITGVTPFAGSFVLKSNAWENYDRIAIGLKTGNANTPDWAIIELAQYARSGVWSTTPATSGGLSHYMVYTMGNGTIPSGVVPLPGAFWFFGTSLLATMGVLGKFNSAKSALRNKIIDRDSSFSSC